MVAAIAVRVAIGRAPSTLVRRSALPVADAVTAWWASLRGRCESEAGDGETCEGGCADSGGDGEKRMTITPVRAGPGVVFGRLPCLFRDTSLNAGRIGRSPGVQLDELDYRPFWPGGAHARTATERRGRGTQGGVRPHPEARLGGIRACSARRLWRGRPSISPVRTRRQEDRIEPRGRRVGRILAVHFAIISLIMLAEHFTRWTRESSSRPVTDTPSRRPRPTGAPPRLRSLADFESMAHAAFARLPEEFRAAVRGPRDPGRGLPRRRDAGRHGMRERVRPARPLPRRRPGATARDAAHRAVPQHGLALPPCRSWTTGPSTRKPSATSSRMCWCTRSATISAFRTRTWRRSRRR